MERSAGAVICSQEARIVRFLMLQYRHRRWDFPRGHIDENESEEVAAHREIFEETGLEKLQFIPGFRAVVSWSYRRGGLGPELHKEVVYFLSEVSRATVRLNHENLEYRWLAYEEARTLPMFPHVTQVLDQAREFLASATRQ